MGELWVVMIHVRAMGNGDCWGYAVVNSEGDSDL